MDFITLNAEPRGVGTSAARAVRRNGNVPCIIYGHGDDPVPFQVPELELKPLIYTSETHLVKVVLGDNSWECIAKEFGFHPVTDRPIHVDFQVLHRGEKVHMMVPIKYVGTPVGQADGGQTQLILNELEISCLPKDIPAHIEIEIGHLKIGDALHIADLDHSIINYLGRPEQTIVSVTTPRGGLGVVEEEEGGFLMEEETQADQEASDTEEA